MSYRDWFDNERRRAAEAAALLGTSGIAQALREHHDREAKRLHESVDNLLGGSLRRYREAAASELHEALDGSATRRMREAAEERNRELAGLADSLGINSVTRGLLDDLQPERQLNRELAEWHRREIERVLPDPAASLRALVGDSYGELVDTARLLSEHLDEQRALRRGVLETVHAVDLLGRSLTHEAPFADVTLARLSDLVGDYSLDGADPVASVDVGALARLDAVPAPIFDRCLDRIAPAPLRQPAHAPAAAPPATPAGTAPAAAAPAFSLEAEIAARVPATSPRIVTTGTAVEHVVVDLLLLLFVRRYGAAWDAHVDPELVQIWVNRAKTARDPFATPAERLLQSNFLEKIKLLKGHFASDIPPELPGALHRVSDLRNRGAHCKPTTRAHQVEIETLATEVFKIVLALL